MSNLCQCDQDFIIDKQYKEPNILELKEPQTLSYPQESVTSVLIQNNILNNIVPINMIALYNNIEDIIKIDNVKNFTKLIEYDQSIVDMSINRLNNSNRSGILNNSNITCIGIAAEYCSYNILQYLIKIKARNDICDNNDNTPLMTLLSSESFSIYRKEIINYLSENVINNTNKYGETALMMAAKTGSYRVCNMLIKSGSNKYIKDENDNTAFDYAYMRYNVDLLPLLHCGSNININQLFNVSNDEQINYIYGRYADFGIEKETFMSLFDISLILHKNRLLNTIIYLFNNGADTSNMSIQLAACLKPAYKQKKEICDLVLRFHRSHTKNIIDEDNIYKFKMRLSKIPRFDFNYVSPLTIAYKLADLETCQMFLNKGYSIFDIPPKTSSEYLRQYFIKNKTSFIDKLDY